MKIKLTSVYVDDQGNACGNLIQITQLARW